MAESYFDQESFAKVDFTTKNINGNEFTNCTFVNCDFSGLTLTRVEFSDCIFDTCNLSSTVLNQVKLDNGQFRKCKMLGINFSQCSDFLFSVGFSDCILDYSIFIGKKLIATKFLNCSLKEGNFSDCNLSQADFSGSDLLMAVFRQTNLEKADFRKALNFSIDPEFNKMKKAKFSQIDLSGLLHKYNLDIF